MENLQFNNRFAGLGDGFYTNLAPTGFATPHMVSFNMQAGELIGISEEEAKTKAFLSFFSGNDIIPGGTYLASVYSGHQFGHYVPQLGDGRAIMIGEVNGYELQLKGSGKTPYSRFGDGRAVLRSTIREYLCSEAMHSLGIPTTRALCIIGSDENVQRETTEKGAMLTRMSPSHIRFGHFEYFYYTGQHDKLRELADFTMENYYSGLNYESFFEEVVTRTAKLIAKWQAVGFAHGVMNTDNMSILGLTIDYGPFGFVETYDPGFICNHSDTSGRYAFNAQPSIGLWNLYALAQSLEPLLAQDVAVAILKKYQPILSTEYISLMRRKVGFLSEEVSDQNILRDVLGLMEKNRVDYTIFFRTLAENGNVRDLFIDRDSYDNWNRIYQQRLEIEPKGREAVMLSASPKYILRNYLAETAIVKARDEGDYSEVDQLLEVLQKPYENQPGMEKYAAEPPEWGKYLEVSCSS